MRPHFLIVLLALCVACGAPRPSAAAEALPVGPERPALSFPHFPSRLHAFVWRNWNAVESDRLAKVLGTTPDKVRAVAESMGLPPERPIPQAFKDRGYITVLRRNWHLLPYDQILTLLDLSADRLAYLLREDDFLFIKLGNLKPKCEPLTYAEPDAAAVERCGQIKKLVRQHFGDEWAKPGEERFAFLKQFEAPVPADRVPPTPGDPLKLPPRYVYSYFAVFGDPLANPKLDPYPDELLRQLADLGITGVWLHVVLRQLAPGGGDFPEFGEGHERRLETLRDLVARARRFGIGVYLYMNEPRAMPPDFFANRPDLAGTREGDHVAMCTSQPAVRGWITNALAHVFKTVPSLAGVFTITASENFTSCASHHNHAGCPRCKDRAGPDIIAEVNAAIEAGVRRGSPDARVICWDWGWPDAWAEPIINALPKSVFLMSVSEWSIPITRGGVNATVGEYSISTVGPGPRATRHWGFAKAAGLKTAAKVQLNNTWELSAVPYLPVLDLVAEHCHNLASANVDGLMMSWSLGGYPSPNLDVARRLRVGQGDGRVQNQPPPTREQVLDAVARDHFGPEGAAHARAAWTAFSNAFREYPYDPGVVYTCPVQVGPANPLYATPTGYAATMVGIPYDAINQWRGPYPAEVFAAQFEKVAGGWAAGLDELVKAAELAPPERSAAARAALGFARAARVHFQSVANQTRFVTLRDALAAAPGGAAERKKLAGELRRVVTGEIELARELFTLTRDDSRIGFEATNHYYYLPGDLVEKVINCEQVLERLGRE